MPRIRGHRSVRMIVTALGAALVFALCALPAAAAPQEPTIGLTELRAEISMAPGGVLPGYFKTVMQGSTVEHIPVNVLAVTGGPSDDLNPDSALVLFEALGPKIDRLGGIAAGMSGSPVYVTIRGTDRLVGALAYGETFTRGGSGLATPIDAMVGVENRVTSAAVPLGTPVVTAAGATDRIVIDADPATARIAASSGALVMRPLASLYIGGMSPNAAPYKAFSKQAEQAGLAVIPLSAPLQTGSERFFAPFTSGSSLAVLAARGDLWVGSLGTVTYVNGDTLMAFGHPLFGEGDTDLYLSNVWIDGVWPSIAAPHKLGTPGALRGSVSQDRTPGVRGRVGATPKDVLIKVTARREDTGASSVSQVAIPSRIVNSISPLWMGLVPFAATVAPFDIYGDTVAAGSALVTTTVTVTDGVRTRAITHVNRYDDDFSVPSAVANDLGTMHTEIQSILSAGVVPLEIVSVDVTATMTARHNKARIVDVAAPGGLRHGANRVVVSMLQRGVAATRTLDATLTIPAGATLNGVLIANSQAAGPEGSYGDEDDAGSTDAADRRGLDELADDIEGAPSNDTLTITFNGYDGGQESGARRTAIVTTVSAPWALEDFSAKVVSQMEAFAGPGRVVAGSGVTVYGSVTGGSEGSIEIWARDAGQRTERIVATGTVTGEDAEGEFEVRIPRLEKTAFLRVVYSGDRDALGCQSRLAVPVAARVTLSASSTSVRRGSPVTLRATVRPGDFGGLVVFERFSAGRWKTIATRRAGGGIASATFTPSSGTEKVRARTVGSVTNASGLSRVIKLSVR